MFNERSSITNQFYPSCGAPIMIDANRMNNQTSHRDRRRIQALPFQWCSIRKVRSLRCHFSKTQVNLNKHPYHCGDDAPPHQIPFWLLATHGRRSILIDVAGTSPRLIHEFERLVERHDCVNYLCCGSRFDGVGERLLTSLPSALHFMPRAARARVTLGLLLNNHVPNVGAYSVINLPTSFEGLDVVSEAMVQQLNTLGLHLNVIAEQPLVDAQRLAAMGVKGIITNALENRSSSRLPGTHIHRRPA